MADIAVFIGRFQPVHVGHLAIADRALQNHTQLIITIGSANRGRITDNPFSYEERVALWKADLKSYCSDKYGAGTETQIMLDRVSFVPVDDVYYCDNEWVAQVRHRITMKANEIAGHDATIAITGHEKDHTSYYLKYFPEWESDLVNSTYATHSSTDIREYFYTKMSILAKASLPPFLDKIDHFGVEQLNGLHNNSLVWNDLFQKILANLALEWDFDQNYDPKRFHVNVLTVDAVVVQAGHILVVRRKHRPGQGLLALPGGHIDEHERLEDAMLRELREETCIDLSNRHLKANIVKREIFDHPNRSTRARVITNAYLISLPAEDTMLKVKGADDAAEAFWMPLSEVTAKDFFEDHAFIIKKLTAGM